MKLRVQGNSIRLRLVRSEVARVAEGHAVEEEVHLAPSPDGTLSYRLSSVDQPEPVAVTYAHSVLDVTISTAQLKIWLQENEVGIYADIGADPHPLHVSIEKDFACLDRSDAENADTFPNPLEGTVC